WSWGPSRTGEPSIRLGAHDTGRSGVVVLRADDRSADPMSNLPFAYRLGERYLYGPQNAVPLFTNNETNGPAVWGAGAASASPYVKDAFHRHIVNGEESVNPEQVGTKACLHYREMIPAGRSVVWRLRLTPNAGLSSPLDEVDDIV